MTDLEKKEIKREYDKKYREINKEKIRERQKKYQKINRENISKKRKEYQKEYRKNNIKNLSEKQKEYRLNNKEKYKENRKINKNNVNEYQKKYNKNRRETDSLFKLKTNIRSLICYSIKNNGYTKKSKTFEMLGCSFEEFKSHIERQFTFGMTWENQGKWHLDHIYPLSLAKDEQETINLNHYTNFQPLWAIENISKGNKIMPNTQIKLI